MKRIAFILLFCLSLGSISAQESAKLYNAGNDALKAKDFAKALENYEKAQAVWGTAPQDYAMLYNCGICAIQLKDYEKAIKYFDSCYTNNFKPEDALFSKAVVYQAQKNNDAFLKTINEGVSKFPENTKFKKVLSGVYYSEGVSKFNSGNTILKSAVDKLKANKFKDANDPVYKSEIVKAKKEFSDAMPSFDKAIELDPANERAKELKTSCEKQVIAK